MMANNEIFFGCQSKSISLLAVRTSHLYLTHLPLRAVFEKIETYLFPLTGFYYIVLGPSYYKEELVVLVLSP